MIEAEGTRYEWLMPKEEGAEAIRMRSMWCESDRDACLSISLALALPLEQRPKLSFLTPPSTPFLNSLMKFIILAANYILIYYLSFFCNSW